MSVFLQRKNASRARVTWQETTFTRKISRNHGLETNTTEKSHVSTVSLSLTW